MARIIKWKVGIINIMLTLFYYSKTSMARPPMARLPRLIRIRSWAPKEFFYKFSYRNI